MSPGTCSISGIPRSGSPTMSAPSCAVGDTDRSACMTTLSRREMLGGALALPALRAAAAEPPPSAAPLPPTPPTDPFGTSLAPFVTRHRGTFGARTIDYTATIGPTVIADGKGYPTARFVTTSYMASGADPATRPVLFAFNGGPS